ncbi:hypothetical protein XELAEV_180355002mg, partial [Xenopus laevis]
GYIIKLDFFSGWTFIGKFIIP